MGLPCEGEVMGVVDIPASTWRDEFLTRFANVPPNDRTPVSYQPFVNAHRPTLVWLQQFSVRILTSYFFFVFIVVEIM
jgi:hypothetical protein